MRLCYYLPLLSDKMTVYEIILQKFAKNGMCGTLLKKNIIN